ncbi:ABC transporter permease [Domibacillus robiginosus]|uniref:ABC transporter permease n=1 Tax=Domibacillus robiginosus TaxID=1071054 RepID=UPI00067CC7D6|nr:ABC transporter permease [Domibacillus robiginosus]
MIAVQLKYDLLMFSREIFYVVFSLLVPPATYIFLGQLFSDSTYPGLSYADMATPSFVLLIAFSVVFFAFGFDQVANRAEGVEKRILLSPVSAEILLLSGILKSIIITSFGFVLIHGIGFWLYDLSLRPVQLLTAYGLFLVFNTVLMTVASAIYSFFTKMKSALVFSIIIFQIVLVTADFSFPVNQMPEFVQTAAQLNPMYHMNHLFIDVWNNQLIWNSGTWISISYLIVLVFIACVILFLQPKKSVK